MDKTNSDFLSGLFIGVVISAAIAALIGIMCWVNDNKGFENKLVIQYHNPHKEYDREMVRNMLESSNVWTNFAIKEIKMDKHRIEYHMSNPIRERK